MKTAQWRADTIEAHINGIEFELKKLSRYEALYSSSHASLRCSIFSLRQRLTEMREIIENEKLN